MSASELLQQAPAAMLIVAGMLLVLALGFLIFFLFPGLGLWLRLGRVSKSLRGIRADDLSGLEQIFSSDRTLRHLWKEFRDTLHTQREERDGQLAVVAYRATAPAESFFNGQNVVDGRLRTEFFKHLPGVFTGIGIIGTFAGLITGLQSFEVPDDPARVRASLELLLAGVYEAFVVSASAIGLAMAVTLVEKLLLASLYRRTDEIAQHLDGLFATGAGEEYLARLVTASEDSAAQARILKDALVGDLKLILQEMTERQIAAQRDSTHALAQNISDSIRTGLEGPLARIGEVVEKASGDQSAAAANMLTDVMASFSQRINELFGGQISGIQELMQKTGHEIQQAVSALNALVGRMEENSKRSGEEMAERMAAAIENMERRQAAINAQSQGFLEAIRELTAKSQSEILDKLQLSIGGLTQQTSALVGSLQTEAKLARQEQRERERTHAESTRAIVQDMSDASARAMDSVRECIEQMRTTVAALERTTTTAIDKMNAGAGRLESGAVAFADAGGKVTQAMEQTATVSGKLTEVSGGLLSSAAALKEGLADYRENRKATTTMVAELRGVVEVAKREAGLTGEALASIEKSAQQLSQAHSVLDRYVEGVSEVILDAHKAFIEGLKLANERANVDFHQKLSSAVGLLSDLIQELEASVAGATRLRK